MKAQQYRAPPRRQVDGVLLLDKPAGLSSNAALQHAKRLFNAAKAGHTGTLDPLANGLLPICFGEAVGCGAHVSALRRTATGGFRVADAVTLEALAALSAEARDRLLLPADAACAALPRCDLLSTEAAGFREGRAVYRAELPDATYR